MKTRSDTTPIPYIGLDVHKGKNRLVILEGNRARLTAS